MRYEQKRERCLACEGTGQTGFWTDAGFFGTGYCPTCDGHGKGYCCHYCGNISQTPLHGRDEVGRPVHRACAPGGEWRTKMELSEIERPPMFGAST